MRIITSSALGATPIAVALTLAMTAGAAAQVASLTGPDESPEPGSADVELEFEDPNDALLAYAACMRDNGIEMDDPEAGQVGMRGFFGRGPDEEDGIDRLSTEFQAARQNCQSILEASRPDIDPEAVQEQVEEQLALAQCIRDQGFEAYPDPAIGSDGRLQRLRGQAASELGIDRRSPEFQEALGTCRDELGLEIGPGLGGGFGGGAGTGGS